MCVCVAGVKNLLVECCYAILLILQFNFNENAFL